MAVDTHSEQAETARAAAAQSAVAALRAVGATLAVAESCTGGLIGHLVTEIPGASQTFLGSAVVYANAAKTALLGVDAALIAAHGAVSEPVAQAMADDQGDCYSHRQGDRADAADDIEQQDQD